MARRQVREAEESIDTSVAPAEKKKRGQAEKVEMVKVGITLTAESWYRFRIMCACQNLTPSMMLQQLVVERSRGFALPRGYAYVPKSERSTIESMPVTSEDGEAA